MFSKQSRANSPTAGEGLSPSLVFRRESGKSIRRRLERQFDATLAHFTKADPQLVRQMPQARWLLDNSHLVRQALQQIENDLPAAYYKQLPRNPKQSKSQPPRIFNLVEKALDQTGLPMDYGALEQYFLDAQAGSNKQLTLGELWVVPTALRISLLSRLCTTQDDVTLIAGCITSLRAVATANWSLFVDTTSVVERTLSKDPLGCYAQMEFSTRDYYRQVIETIANRSTLEQWEVASAALRLAQEKKPDLDSRHQQHLGYYLIDEGRGILEQNVKYRPTFLDRVNRGLRKSRALIYLSSIVVLALMGSGALFFGLVAETSNISLSFALALIALAPLLSVSSGAVNFLVSLAVVPRHLPKLDYSSGITPEHQSIVVVPMLLSSKSDIEENLATLERNYLGNVDSQLQFALLSDFTDAQQAEVAEDASLLDLAVTGIDALNRRHATEGSASFHLFHRRRLWNENAQQWMGWERKRGKLDEFNELLRGDKNTSYVLHQGSDINLAAIRYVITLDADSYMPAGTARRLVGAMAHPLNQPRFDDSTQRIVGGYTILQPRLETNPTTGADTPFARIFAGDVMLDLYTHAVSDIYQDVFGDAVFAGKGIYEVDTFQRCVADQVPENSVLSHDLLEGLLGRVGLASDIVLLENYPSNYLAYLKRLHRWVRGDWQLLPWLISPKSAGPRPFKPGAIGRWKLFDNLRRSLVTPAILALLISGWLWLPANTITWTIVFALFPGLPILLRITLAFRTSLWRWGTIASSVRNLAGHAGADMARWLLALVFLPAEAYAVVDAALRTLYRLTISHRRMLEWSTAAQVSHEIAKSKQTLNFWRHLWFGPAMAVIVGALIIGLNPPALLAASIFLLSWLCSPLIAQRLGRQVTEQPQVTLTDADTELLRGIARDTWRFFERFVGPETHWLPPDNVQEYPRRIIAERTSPTNIGMMLLSTLTAYDFGYIGPHQLVVRLKNHLKTVQDLQKHRGHLLNWYSTRDLEPLEPRYVSTVDSGNFVAALVTIRQALEELPQKALITERTLTGLNDEIDTLRRLLFTADTTNTTTIQALIQALDSAQAALENPNQPLMAVNEIERQHCSNIEQRFLAALIEQPHRWSAEEIAHFRENTQVLRQRVRNIVVDVNLYMPWLEQLSLLPGLAKNTDYQALFTRLDETLNAVQHTEAAEPLYAAAQKLTEQLLHQLDRVTVDQAANEARTWLQALQHSVVQATKARSDQELARKMLISVTTQLIEATEFDFLYDKTRHLFRVGYNASTGEADSSYYDLLASEARIASFLAIANGDIPAKHWMYLGRPLTRIRGLRILLSWSATAFEYLMPRLLMHSPPRGLIDQSCEGAVNEQIRFGREHGIPWGVSESGYALFDQQQHYQYFAFGIPKLGLKWDQGERLVVSSYSCVLALPYVPAAAVQNLRRMITLDAGGHYGLFEALDFGDAHQPRPARPRVVQSYMAHHQGMILVAIGNAIHHDETLRRFHRDPQVASVEYLLYERLPQRMQTRPLERLPAPLKELPAQPATVAQWTVESDQPELALLSNSHLSSRVSDQGGSGLYWQGKAATRWNPLAKGPTGGSYLYLKDLDTGRLRSFGGGPRPTDVEAIFAPHAAEFRARRDDLLMRLTISIAPEVDTEIRRVVITNDGLTTRRIQLSSYTEPLLGLDDADRRHPAFSKLFIATQYLAGDQTLLFRRRSRESDQPPMYLAHTTVVQTNQETARSIEVDRGAFIGRNANPSEPAALMDPGYVAGETTTETLDPCASITLSFEIPPGTKIECAFLTSVADSRQRALAALQPFRSLERIDWAIEAARLYSERELTELRMASDTVQASFRLLANILWPNNVPQAAGHAFDQFYQAQDALWRHGISGDRAIVTQRVDGDEDLDLTDGLLNQVNYTSRKGFSIDAVFLDETESGYTHPTNDRLRQLIKTGLDTGRDRDGAQAYVVPVRNLSVHERANLIAAARFYIDASSYTSGKDFTLIDRRPRAMPAFVPQPSAPLSNEPTIPVALADELLFRNRFGGMLPDFSGYALFVSDKSRPPAPWCNIVANPDFGSLISEAGSMFTWWGNSSENRLTPWSNDAVLDQTGEALYVRDEETAEHWSLTPLVRNDNVPYLVTHAIGASTFEHNRHGLQQHLEVFVDPEKPVKFLSIRLTNLWQRSRRLTVTFAVEWLLGNAHHFDRHLLLPDRDDQTGALLIRNGFERNAGEALAFIASDLPAHGVTCDGSEFFGRHHDWSSPPGLAAVGLSNRIAPNANPTAVYQIHIDLQAMQTREFHFVLGAAGNRDDANALIADACSRKWLLDRHSLSRQQWDQLLSTWQVSTPDKATNAMVNRWLLYQVLASRLWGRTGFYQASGGYGFRDQLQDVLALLDTKPEAARAQIGIAASRQFEEGDVLHWWHESPLRGVRTRCSDDLLWLAYALAEYIDVTDDASILHDQAPFLLGEPLGERELERYAEFQQSERTASLYDHCCRAIDARTSFGQHGLPFIGTGDWNDGLNRVGEKGRGESVWMAWFLIVIYRRFAPLCRQMDDPGRADHYERVASELMRRTKQTAWAGDWYLRGYFDDGAPLGAPGNVESEIDLNAQTWAVLADAEDPMARQAMLALEDKLIDPEHRLIKLLAPPFEKASHDPGYIASYPPGVRENGGQYTHAAVWAPWAAVQLGDKDNAMRWFDWLNPLKRACSDLEIEHYRLEPYVTAGDIYGTDPFAGRGGWSWYTGSAAWLYRFAIRQLLGLQRRGDHLFIRPCLPDTWPKYEASFRYKAAEHRFCVHEPSQIHDDKLFVVVNGINSDVDSIELEEVGQIEIQVFASDAARRAWVSEQSESGSSPISPPLDGETTHSIKS